MNDSSELSVQLRVVLQHWGEPSKALSHSGESSKQSQYHSFFNHVAIPIPSSYFQIVCGISINGVVLMGWLKELPQPHHIQASCDTVTGLIIRHVTLLPLQPNSKQSQASLHLLHRQNSLRSHCYLWHSYTTHCDTVTGPTVIQLHDPLWYITGPTITATHIICRFVQEGNMGLYVHRNH